MTQQQFEAHTGKQVSADVWADIVAVYNATDHMDEQEFCTAWSEGRLWLIFRELVARNKSLTKWNKFFEERTDQKDAALVEAATTMLEAAYRHHDITLKAAAVKLIGIERAVRIDLTSGYTLSQEERDHLLENI